MASLKKLCYALALQKAKHFPETYQYKEGRYAIPFLQDIDFDLHTLINPQRVIYCFWTGTNPLTPNRLVGLRTMKENAGVPVVLVTPNNLSSFVLKDHPLHPAYEYLSCVHKADYLRCYFMYHYGGGYSDIKPCTRSWLPSFHLIEQNPDKYALGFSEIHPRDVAYPDCFYPRKEFKRINRDMLFNFNRLIGMGAFISRPGTPMTKRWLDELHRRLDLKLEDLKKNPGNVWGDSEGYPIKWNAILGQIFHPLCLVYNKFIIHDNRIKPVLKNYR